MYIDKSSIHENYSIVKMYSKIHVLKEEIFLTYLRACCQSIIVKTREVCCQDVKFVGVKLKVVRTRKKEKSKREKD